MNVGIFYYDQFANHEIVIACHEFRKENVISIGLEKGIYQSTEKQRISADYSLDEIEPEDLDVFIIPGGITEDIQRNAELKLFINRLNDKGRLIAGICGGTFIIAESGVLKDRNCTGHFIKFEDDTAEKALFDESKLLDEDVVVDGNIVTARGKAIVEFALVLAKRAGLYQNSADYAEEYSWLKNQI